jgi:hAT family C-terminal dimerisation region
VEKKKDIVYPLVYKLLSLALILSVATASVERAFSAMNVVKEISRNRMRDQWLNDCLVTYIEERFV